MTNTTQPNALRLAAILLLAAATVLFAIGAAAERASSPAPATAPVSAEAPGHAEGTGAEGSGGETAAHHDSDSAGGGEAILGIDPEGTPALVVALLASAAIGCVLWLWWRRPLPLIVALLFVVGFTALDVREVVHQAGIPSQTLALLAAGVGVLHAATAVALALLLRAVEQPRATA